MNLSSNTLDRPIVNFAGEDVREYVAQLQLHMTLQARNLIPNISHTATNSREQLLQETQAHVEKLISRGLS